MEVQCQAVFPTECFIWCHQPSGDHTPQASPHVVSVHLDAEIGIMVRLDFEWCVRSQWKRLPGERHLTDDETPSGPKTQCIRGAIRSRNILWCWPIEYLVSRNIPQQDDLNKRPLESTSALPKSMYVCAFIGLPRWVNRGIIAPQMRFTDNHSTTIRTTVALSAWCVPPPG